MTIEKKTMGALALVAAGGIFAGFVNGFLGAGGGIILLWIFSRTNPPTDPFALRDNFASTVAIVLLLSTVSAVTYSHTGSVDTRALLSFALPGMIGGVVGAYLTDRLNTVALKLAFSVIIIIAGFNMIR